MAGVPACLPERVRERFGDIGRFEHRGWCSRATETSRSRGSSRSRPSVPCARCTVELCGDRETPPFGDAPYLAHVRKLSIITDRDRLLNSELDAARRNDDVPRGAR